MSSLRAFLSVHRGLALALLALALSMKALVPSGFMLDGAGKALTVTICGQTSVSIAEHTLEIPLGKAQHGNGEQSHASQVCPYSVLAMAAMDGGAAPLFAAALAFILAAGLLPPFAPILRARAFLRPPLRAPPLRA